ncbi:HD-GYP domain-containing protein [Paenibacillus pini]|uniref:Response regulator receiver modulated metal dependent phosphohydrolase n=1 Tax=Paenibacillus pini JCM 16418 TaxID=1236976 RepID=W7YF77_9BACL|nr:HD-GYP domain-containing protein [Paenibacillus pini]GAF09570.1 response regulator receiver modulated metal dependent phosphohydrolase [Paenibacillus pini JCM 16418]
MSLDGLLGKKTKYDITNNRGLVLVPARVKLTQEHIHLLQQHGIETSDVTLMSTSDSDSSSLVSLVEDTANYAKDLFYRIKTTRKIPLLEIKDELIPFVKQVSEHADLYKLFESIRAKDEYTYQHNIGVGILSTLIGRWMKWDETEIALLSLAATMHDVGKVRIPQEILLKPGKLTNEEYEEMKRHTIYGYEMLKETVGISPRVAWVALQHHERANGSGYPLKLKQDQIDPMSRIVAVADIFHAMSSKRPYQDALPFYEIVARMRQGFFGELDPHIVAVFLNNLIRNLIGRSVKLSNGQWGEVVYINPHDDTNPLVKVGQNYLDLSKDREIHIQEVI